VNAFTEGENPVVRPRSAAHLPEDGLPLEQLRSQLADEVAEGYASREVIERDYGGSEAVSADE
jgi:hypothetical protein